MRRSGPRSRALFLTGHPALDFLNTRIRVNGELVDVLQRDEDVLRWLGNTPAGILAPVAEAAADLLATADFTLVRRCEDETCVLWFSDQSTSMR